MVITILYFLWLLQYFIVYGYYNTLLFMVITILYCLWLLQYFIVYGYYNTLLDIEIDSLIYSGAEIV